MLYCQLSRPYKNHRTTVRQPPDPPYFPYGRTSALSSGFGKTERDNEMKLEIRVVDVLVGATAEKTEALLNVPY